MARCASVVRAGAALVALAIGIWILARAIALRVEYFDGWDHLLDCAAVVALPWLLLALGSAVSSSFRQLGAVLGVSVFAALLGTAAGAAEVHAYHHLWLVFATLSLASGAVLYLPRVRAVKAARPGLR